MKQRIKVNVQQLKLISTLLSVNTVWYYLKESFSMEVTAMMRRIAGHVVSLCSTKIKKAVHDCPFHFPFLIGNFSGARLFLHSSTCSGLLFCLISFLFWMLTLSFGSTTPQCSVMGRLWRFHDLRRLHLSMLHCNV